MAVPGVPCTGCGQKRGHKAGCTYATPCEECGFATGHADNCPRAYNQQRDRETAEEEARNRKEHQLVDGAESDIVLDGKSGGVKQEELIQVSVEELCDTLATHLAIRARYETHREYWQKKVKGANDAIDRIVKALGDRGHTKDDIMQRLDAYAPERK